MSTGVSAGGARRTEGFVPGAHPIDAYGAGGFRFAEMSHRGSILALPSGLYAWAPRAVAEIDEASLAPLLADTSRIEHLLVGTGAELVPLPALVVARLRDAGVRAEPMPTRAATMTYNILFGEGRLVAAGLIAVE